MLETMRDEVVGITATPGGLRLYAASDLTGRRRTRALATTHAVVGHKPSATDAAGPLREHPQMLASTAGNQSGPLLASNPGSILASAEDLVIGRGLSADRDMLLRRLRAVGYYRLCAYWHPFKQADDSFAPGTTFDAVWERYTFDRQLRLAVINAIERVEVAVRSSLLTGLALQGGPFVHLDIANFPGVLPTKHRRFIDELRERAQNSSEVFVNHFRATYDEFPDLPIWAAAEIMSFGTMLSLFKMSGKRVQNAVARRYGLAGKVLLSWLLTLNYTRNLCAHHSRLWNRELAVICLSGCFR